MDIFVSPLATVLAKFIAFLAGSVLAVLILLSVWDEDVLNVDHVLTLITVLGAAVAGARWDWLTLNSREFFFGSRKKIMRRKSYRQKMYSCLVLFLNNRHRLIDLWIDRQIKAKADTLTIMIPNKSFQQGNLTLRKSTK